jgi:hypothetical protein
MTVALMSSIEGDDITGQQPPHDCCNRKLSRS